MRFLLLVRLKTRVERGFWRDLRGFPLFYLQPRL